MELQHNLSFPLFIKKSCIFEKHICSDWGISATHKRLLQSPCHVAYSKKGSLIAISIPVPPPADFRSCDGCSGLVNGVGLRTGKQGRRLWFASFIFDLILTLNPADCPAAALPVQAEGEVQPLLPLAQDRVWEESNSNDNLDAASKGGSQALLLPEWVPL